MNEIIGEIKSMLEMTKKKLKRRNFIALGFEFVGSKIVGSLVLLVLDARKLQPFPNF
jgi:hypothetical protein